MPNISLEKDAHSAGLHSHLSSWSLVTCQIRHLYEHVKMDLISELRKYPERLQPSIFVSKLNEPIEIARQGLALGVKEGVLYRVNWKGRGQIIQLFKVVPLFIPITDWTMPPTRK